MKIFVILLVFPLHFAILKGIFNRLQNTKELLYLAMKWWFWYRKWTRSRTSDDQITSDFFSGSVNAWTKLIYGQLGMTPAVKILCTKVSVTTIFLETLSFIRISCTLFEEFALMMSNAPPPARRQIGERPRPQPSIGGHYRQKLYR